MSASSLPIPVAQEGIDLLSAQAQVDVQTGLAPDELIAKIADYDGPRGTAARPTSPRR